MNGLPYHRPARVYPEALPSGEITIVAPPVAVQLPKGVAVWLPFLMPVVGSLGAIGFVFIYHNFWMMVFGIGFAVCSILSGFLMWWSQRRTIKLQHRRHRDKYIKYLTAQEEKLQNIASQQQALHNTLFPTVGEWALLAEARQRVWERRRSDADFLCVSMARGPVKLCCPLRMDAADNPLVDFDPQLLQRASTLVKTYETVPDSPIPLSLRTLASLMVTGDTADGRALVRALLSQVALFHAPNDVQVMAYCEGSAASDWSWLRWLPHVRRGGGTLLASGVSLCYIADNPADFAAMFEEQIRPRTKRVHRTDQPIPDAAIALAQPPHLLLVVDGLCSAGRIGDIEMAELDAHARQAGITILYLAGPEPEVPAWVEARIAATAPFLYEELRFEGRRVTDGKPEHLNVDGAETMARALAPLRISERRSATDLAETVRLADVMQTNGVGEASGGPEPLWRMGWNEGLLRFPFGVKLDGQPLVLDLKEAAEGGMGPHGLIVGATGSGKSELLRTMVSAMAATHAPDLLNFVFVDFKGGAAFAELATLPHSAGMVTNLEQDLTLVDRIHASLFGELERRERLLREAGNLDNIKQYHAKRELHGATEPLPYLLVIVDEFGELLANRPEFQELFIAIGRVGRSIGMHLLLATQRLHEGRVRGLEGHLRYRICLRTFSAEESTSVLGRPDAFYLPPFPGVGYFKVDTDVMELFKTASVSMRYVEAPPVRSLRDVVQTFTPQGKLVPVYPVLADAGVARGQDAAKTDMSVLISRLAAFRGYTAHQVWLPPLPSKVTLGQVLAAVDGGHAGPVPLRSSSSGLDHLQVPVGWLDLPTEQRQEPLVLTFSGSVGHLAVVGAPQSGKSTLLRAIAAGLLTTHSPRDVQIYAIDCGGGLLRLFDGAPHVGAVYGKADKEKIPQLIRHVRTIIEDRERLFRDRGIDSMASYRALRETGGFDDVPYGDVFLMVDDIAQLQAEFETIDFELSDIVTAGLSVGVHVIVSANRWPDIRIKLRDNIGGRLELRLNDPVDSDIASAAQASLPSGVPGRGLTRQRLHFQTALPVLSPLAPDSDIDVKSGLLSLIGAVTAAWEGPPAPPVRVLPGLVTRADLAGQYPGSGAGVTVGIESSKLEPVVFDLEASDPHLLIIGDSESGKTNLLRHWMSVLIARTAPDDVNIAVVDYRRTLIDIADAPHLFGYACTAPMVTEMVNRLLAKLGERMPSSQDLSLASLRNRDRWTGPHYYLFVDDYDWVASQGISPLAPLVDVLLQSRDLGFHLILTRRLGGTSSSMYESVFKRLREMGTPTFVMNGDAQEAKLLGCPSAANLPPGRGYLMRRNQKTLLVQTVFDASRCGGDGEAGDSEAEGA